MAVELEVEDGSHDEGEMFTYGGKLSDRLQVSIMAYIRPTSTVEDRGPKIIDATDSAPVKLDAGVQALISKHRKLQEDLPDEMVGLAQQLKEITLMLNQSIKNTEKIQKL